MLQHIIYCFIIFLINIAEISCQFDIFLTSTNNRAGSSTNHIFEI